MSQAPQESIIPRATSVQAVGSWTGDAMDSILLDFEGRHRRRIQMTASNGTVFLLDLPEVIALRSGDALVLADGRKIEVIASPEPLAEIRVDQPNSLARFAWHIGNRHLAIQIMPRALRIRADHVIEEMLEGMGARVAHIEAPFDPEGGAYAKAKPMQADPSATHHHNHDHHAHKHDVASCNDPSHDHH